MGEYNKNILDNDAMQSPQVSICSITYNHAPFIRQCLDGFLMQKTNFKYEIIIHDDASTDGTAEIIKEYAEKYPDLITPIFQTENQYSKGVRGFYAKFVFPKAKGKYIAMCEGDDYWIDPLKLQKQVDFLEANPKYFICTHNYDILNNNIININQSYENLEFIEENNYTYFEFNQDNYFQGWYTQPLTTLFRNHNILTSLPYHKYTYFRDTIFFYLLIKNGKGALLKNTMGVYRKHDGGIFTSQSFFTNQKIALITALELYKNEKDKNSYILMNQVMYGLICYLKIDKSLFLKVLSLFLHYLKNAPFEAIRLLLLKFYSRF